MRRKDDYTVKHLMTEKTGVIVAGVILVIMITTTVIGGSGSPQSDITRVALIDNGTEETVVEADTAITRNEKYTGLSKHNTLQNGSGMVFIHDTEQTQTYVMRNMDFGIDMVFIDNDCSVTTIHSAEEPAPLETGEEAKHRYSGIAKYILEVPKGYATQYIEQGDTVNIQDTPCDAYFTANRSVTG